MKRGNGARMLTVVGAVVGGLLITATSSAAVYVDDTFNDGGVSNGPDLLDVAWANVVNVTPSVSGGEMIYNSLRGVDGSFPILRGNTFAANPTLANVGDTLSFSYNVRVLGLNGNNVGGGFRTGLATNADLYSYNYGTGSTTSASITVYPDPNLPSGGGTTNATTSATPVSLNDLLTHFVQITYTRSGANELTITAKLDSSVPTVGVVSGVTDFTFNRIILGQGGLNNVDLAYDNFLIEDVIPEPASLALAGVGLALMATRRRRT